MSTRPAPERCLYNPAYCPFTATWNVIGGKWKGILWWRLSNGLGRFSDLQRAIPQVTKKMLAQQLREMERDGLVHREVFPEVSPQVEYSLTACGQSLAPVIGMICQWGGQHLQRNRVVKT